MGDSHSFENTVVAVLAAGSSDDALQQLSAAGYDYEVMEGESGGRHLDPGGEGGIWSALKRAAAALGTRPGYWIGSIRNWRRANSLFPWTSRDAKANKRSRSSASTMESSSGNSGTGPLPRLRSSPGVLRIL